RSPRHLLDRRARGELRLCPPFACVLAPGLPALLAATGHRLVSQAILQLALDLLELFRFRVERQRVLPLKSCLAAAAYAPEPVTQMSVQNRVLGPRFAGRFQETDRFVVSAERVLRPAEHVDDVAVGGLQRVGLLAELEPLPQI